MSTRRPRREPGTDKTYGRVAKVGAIWGVGRQSVAQMVHLGAGIILARLLTPYEFGIAAAVGFFLKLANKVGSLGLGSALVRVKHLTPEHVSSVFVVNLALGITVWAVLTISAPALGRVFNNDAVAPALRIAALVYLLLPFGAGQTANMNRQFRFKRLAAVEWTNVSVFFIVSVSMAWNGYSYWSVIYGTLASDAAAILMKVLLGGVQPSLRFSRKAFLEVIPFGIGLQAKRLLTFCAEYLDSLIVGRMLGLAALGLYDKAFSTVDRTTDRLTLGPAVFFRIFSVLREDPERLRRAYQKAATAMSLLGLPTFAVLIVAGPELIPFVYGDQWRDSVLPFQILCVAGAFRVTAAYASAVTQAQGQIWSEIARLVFYAAAVVVGAIVGSWWGIVGVAAGIAAANGLRALLMQALVCRLTQLTQREVTAAQLPGLWFALVAVAITLASSLAFASVRPEAADWERLAVKLLAAGAAGLWLLLKPPSANVRSIRDEVVADLAPGLGRFIPGWTPAAASTPRPEGKRRRKGADVLVHAPGEERAPGL